MDEEEKKTAQEQEEEVKEPEQKTAPEPRTDSSKEGQEKSRDRKMREKEKDKRIRELEASLLGAEGKVQKRDEMLQAGQEKLDRLLAEFDNYKKRTQKEKEAVHDETVGEIFSQLLPILDNLERAAAYTDAGDVAKGVQMTLTAFRAVMEKYDVHEVGAPGEPFNPEWHNAVAHIESEDFGENVIAAIYQKGYRVGTRIIRPAMVQIAN
ncbi:MAG: nucleotide exchange factor GrpE [Clostridia bacterium]|nr:nucleotide exchange factor GrpE [Clostridia bacterium]